MKIAPYIEWPEPNVVAGAMLKCLETAQTQRTFFLLGDVVYSDACWKRMLDPRQPEPIACYGSLKQDEIFSASFLAKHIPTIQSYLQSALRHGQALKSHGDLWHMLALLSGWEPVQILDHDVFLENRNPR